MASKSQDVDSTASNGTVVAKSPFQSLRRRMAEMAVTETAFSRVAGEDINAILTAEDEAAMWDADELDLWNAQKLSGCDLQTTGFEVRFGDGNSDIENPLFVDDKGREMYLLVHSFRITEAREHKEYNHPEIGLEFVWNTSARNIVGKLFWMLDHGWFDPGAAPVRFTIKGTKIKGGKQTVEKLKEFTGTPLIEAAVLTGDSAPF